MDTKSIVGIIVAVIVSGLLAWGVSSATISGYASTINQDIQNAVSSASHTVGAVASPDIPSPYLQWGGLQTWNASSFMRAATTTPSAMQAPANATSTLDVAGCSILVASTTATSWEFFNSANAYATSSATLIGTLYNVGASKQAFIQASTTATAGALTVFAPGSWLVIDERGGITGGDTLGTGFVPSGRCFADWEAMPNS